MWELFKKSVDSGMCTILALIIRTVKNSGHMALFEGTLSDSSSSFGTLEWRCAWRDRWHQQPCDLHLCVWWQWRQGKSVFHVATLPFSSQLFSNTWFPVSHRNMWEPWKTKGKVGSVLSLSVMSHLNLQVRVYYHLHINAVTLFGSLEWQEPCIQ